MARLPLLGLLLVVSGCWVEDSQFCHEFASSKSSCSCTRTCGGETAHWSYEYCQGDEKIGTVTKECAKSCSGASTCADCECHTLKTPCVTTVCGV